MWSRRRVIALAAAAPALAAVILAVVLRSDESGGKPASGSTLEATWVDIDGDGVLERGPGEPLLDRTELAPAAQPGRQLAFFAQLTDVHLVDEESPARVEMLDRLGAPFTSAFRPQESLVPRVLAAAVRALNALGPQAVVETGDLVDNAQANELGQALSILAGGRVDPGSGGRAYEGVQEAANPDPFYYRPAADPPRRPGLLAAAERPFRTPGLRAPWYPVAGNHDLLAAGNVAPTARIQAAARSGRKLVQLRSDVLDAATERVLTARVVRDLLELPSLGTERRVTPDPRRRLLRPDEMLRRLREASGHGSPGPLLDYTFDLGPRVRAIVLDTTRRGAGAGGVVRSSQVRWLAGRLRSAGGRRILVFSHAPLAQSEGGRRALGLLDADPRVVAAVAGHVHRNSIEPRKRGRHGYWVITTASLADYPQQVRAFRLVETASRGLALQTWMVDTDPASRLATTARELAFLDFQGGRPRRWAGRPIDRNATLYVR